MANTLGPDLSNAKKQRIAQKKDELSSFAAFSEAVDKRVSAFSEINRANEAEQIRRAQIDQQTWTRNSELGSLTGQTKQLVNRLAQGGLQTLSEVVAGSNNTEAIRLLGKLDDRALNLAQRELNGETLSTDESTYLDQQVDTSQFYLPKFGTSSHHMPSSSTAREVFAEALANLKQAGNIDKALTQDTAIAKGFNPLNREALSGDIDNAINQSGLSKEESLTSNPMALLNFVLKGGKAIIDNPAAAFEYAAESAVPAAATAVPGLGAINSFNYASDVRANVIDKKLQDKDTTVSKDDIEEATTEAALAGALDFVGDAVTARAAGILKAARRKGKTPDAEVTPKTTKQKVKDELLVRPAKVIGSSAVEAVTEGTQTAIEEDAFGEDFNMKEDAKAVLEAAVIGAGASGAISGTGQAAQATKQAVKEASSAVLSAGKKAKDKNIANSEEDVQRKARVEQEVGVAKETNNYTDLIEKSTAEVEKTEKLDIEEIASTISRPLESTAQNESEISEESVDEVVTNLGNLWDAAVNRLDAVMQEEQAATDDKKPALQKQASEISDAIDIIEQYQEKATAQIVKKNKTFEAIDNVTKATERNEEFELNAQRILDTDAISPDSISVEQMEALLKSDKWTPEERTRLENSFASKNAMEVISESKDVYKSSPNVDLVNNDVLNGRSKGTYGNGDKGALGVKSYRAKIGRALKTGNIEAANRARDYLASFAEKHTKKSEAIQLALGAYARVGQNNNFKLEYNEQEKAAVDYLAREHKFEMQSGTPRIAPSIQREAEALQAVLTEVDGLIQAKRDVDPISVKTTQTTPTATTQPTSAPGTTPQAAQETPTATADASPTVTETTTPEATETVSNDTVEQPTTTATQPETQTTPEENTQTVTEPEISSNDMTEAEQQEAMTALNTHINNTFNAAGPDGSKMRRIYSDLEDSDSEKRVELLNELETYAAKSEANRKLADLILEMDSGSVNIPGYTAPSKSTTTTETSSTEQEAGTQETESESEAVTDEAEQTDTNLEQALKDSRAEEVQVEAKVNELREQLSDKEGITNQVTAELGLADKEALTPQERGQVRQAVNERQGEILTQIQNYKADLKAVRNSTRALEGQVADFDGTAKAFENEDFSKKFVPAPKKTLVRAIPNLISQLKRAPSTVLAYAKEFTSLTSNQKGAIKHFTQFAEAFGERLNTIPNLEEIAKKPEFHLYTPLMEDGEFTETAKAGLAAAAYTWLANDAKGTRYTDAQVLARRFNISDSDKVPASLVGVLSKDGLPINMLYKSLGQNVISALGIRLNEVSASTRDMSVLQLQLGQMVVATMSDMGMLDVRQRPMADVIQSGNAEVRENVLLQVGVTKEKQEKLTAKELDEIISKIPYTTAIVKHDPTTEPFDVDGLSPEVLAIVKANEETDYVIENLFETRSVDREPSLKPGTGIKEGALMKGTIKQVSERTREMTAEQEQKAITIVQDNDLVMSMLNDDDPDGEGSEIERVLGIESKNRLKAMPKRMRDSAEAKGNGLLNEWNKYKTWRDKLSLMKDGLATPFYLAMEVWNYGRFGYTNQTINPQTSKIHRALVGMKSWRETVSVTDGPKIQAFLLGVAQGLDIDIDKQTKEASLAALDGIINDSDNVFNSGAVAINELKANGKEWANTEEGKAAREKVVKAVEAGKHNVHSLHALTNLARYIVAEDTFEADIWLEIDGITNGVVIGSIIFGNGTASNLREELEAGGIFFNEKRDYGEHASTEGNKDFYERQAEIWQEYLQDEIVAAKRKPDSIESKRLFAAIQFFTGLDVFSDGALKISRKMAKSPLMQNVYGAGSTSLSNDLADAIIDNLDTTIDKILNHKGKKVGGKTVQASDTQKLQLINRKLEQIRPLLTTSKGKKFDLFNGGDVFTSLDDVREAEYDKFGLKILQGNIKSDFSAPMIDAIEKHFQAFKFNRAVYIDNMANQADVFKSLYEMRVKEEKERLVNEGVITATDEIPEATRKAIASELHHIMPAVENPNGDGTYETDLQAIKVEDVAARTAKGNAYRANVRPNKAVKVQVLQPDGSFAEGSLNTLSTTATVRTFSNNIGPGVGVQNIHGNDAGIIQPVVAKFDIFNVHDGIPAGLSNYQEVGQAANQAFLDNVFNNNPFSYAKDLIDRTVDEIKERKSRGEISPSTAKQLIDKLTNSKKMKFGKPARDGGNDYQFLTKKAIETSNRLGELRGTVESVQQYYLPGTGVTTELGKKNDEARSNGTYEAPKAPELSKDGATQTASTVQRTKEMQQKNLKEDTSATGSKDTSKFATTIEKALLSGESFTAAFKAAIEATGSKGYHVSLINKLLEKLPSDFEVQLVNKDSDSKLVEKMAGIRGAHIKGTGKLLLKSTDFAKNSLNLETLAHELLHVVTANTIDAEPDNPAVKKLYDLLKELRGKITDSKFLPALENTKELVAWGLTNKDFINRLKRTTVKGRINGKLLNAFTAFADALKGFFGKDKALRNDNALKQLIELSAAVMEADSKLNPRSHSSDIDLNAQRIQSMTPQELIRGLAAHGEVTAEHTDHLVSIQEDIVNTFAGPMGADLKLEEEALGDDVDQYLTHLTNGTRPFVSTIRNVFNLSPQEAYVAEQLEAVLDSKILDPGFVKNRLVKVWEAANESLTWESFLPSPDFKDDAVEVGKAKAKYDYLFNTSNLNKGNYGFDPLAGKNVDSRASDFLMRFAAAASVSSEVRDLLTGLDENTSTSDGSIWSRLNSTLTTMFGRMEELVNGNIRKGNDLKSKHDLLLNRLAQTSHRNRHKLNLLERKSLETKTILNSYLSKPIKGALSGEFVKERTNSDKPFVAAVANIAYLAGTETGSTLTQLIRSKFKKDNEDRPSMFNETLTEVFGRKHPDMDAIIDLTRKNNRDVEQKRQFGKLGMIKLLENKLGKLSDNLNASLHKALLSTDAAHLLANGYDINQIDELLKDDAVLSNEIDDVVSRISGFTHHTLYMNQAKALAYYMVTGNATSDILHKNAHQIVNLNGFNLKVNDDRKDTAIKLVDKLVSLYAMSYTSSGHKKAASQLIREQNQQPENGVEFMLKQYEQLRLDALEANFDGEVTQMTKGFTPEMTNPHITHDYALPGSDKAKRLIKQGYRLKTVVDRDHRLDNSKGLALFVIEDGGLARRVTGTMSYTAGAMKGTEWIDSMEKAEQPITYKNRQKLLNGMKGTARKNARARMSNPNFDPREVEKDAGVMMIPTFHNDGTIKTFRYEMSEALRESSLDKLYNAFEAMGTMQGNVVDKRNTRDRNRDVVDTLLEQYEIDGKESDYVFISPHSKSDYLKEYWNLLPHDTKQYIQEKFNANKLPIKRELLHTVMGFRKRSLSDIFRDNPETQGYVTTLVRKGIEGILNEDQTSKLIRGIKKGEDGFAVATSIIKDNVVVKNLWTTMFNIVSNFLHLLGNDVPLRQAFSGSVRGYREAAKYNKLRQRAYDVEREMLTENTSTDKYSKLRNEANKLQTLMATSPVHKLMEAGLFQTIVEDIDTMTDPFSFKSKAAKKIDEWSDAKRLGPLNKLGKFMYVTQDTQLYKMMNQPIQMSDFAARFAMYEYLTEMAPERMDDQTALNTVSEHFVNYDIPTSPQLQWLNDHGLLMFSKYYLRILRPVWSTFAEKPASSILSIMMTMENALTSPLETVLTSSVFDKLTTPISSALDAWDEPLPMQAIGQVL